MEAEATRPIPHIIDGKDFGLFRDAKLDTVSLAPRNHTLATVLYLTANEDSCKACADSAAAAFPSWAATRPSERQALFIKLADLLEAKREEIKQIITEELYCSEKWANINYKDSLELIRHVAALITSSVFDGVCPVVRDPQAHAVVLKEPLGVILGIAPWNAPLILGFRAIAAAVATGNTAILKGSELSPRTHYFIAKLFQEAGFPPGVVNFLVHSTDKAATCFEALISHPGVRKCNFTGSTVVGRQIATRAAAYLKPCLLELGGKNYAIVMPDANLSRTVEDVLLGGYLNAGQICMSTDIVLVSSSVVDEFRQLLQEGLRKPSGGPPVLVVGHAEQKVQRLIADAESKGSRPIRATAAVDTALACTIIDPLSPDMEFWKTESFGPVIGLRTYDHEEEVVQMVNQSDFGLSAAIFSRDTLYAFELGKKLAVGAVHINAPTVHDEPALPHGGVKESGWGRFGSHWAFNEFLQTKTVILHPA